MMKHKGKAWKFGNDVNTDLIIPGKYLELVDPEEMAEHAMEGIDPEFPKKIQKGDIVVGGTNFGCGSSREHAPLALKYAGISSVVAESFARIYYRNSINIGLPALECPGIVDAVEDGEVVEVDIPRGIVKNVSTGAELSFTPLPGFMVEILGEGGLVTYIRNHLDEW
jgi:3-isopropylmalate/(R)-2-methylmalate dehydratase small subunit